MPNDSIVPYPRSSEFYIQHIILLVDGVLYQMPRYLFEKHSEIFATMFTLPQEGTMVEGSDDQHPIELQGISKDDFEPLLNVMLTYGFESPPLKQNEWFSVLRLANMWGMARIRKSALRKLTKSMPLDAVERVVYGRELAVAEWAISGLRDLVARQTAISKEESTRLGVDTIFKLSNIQLKAGISSWSSAPGKGGNSKIDVELNQSFGPEITDIHHRAVALGYEVPSAAPSFIQ
ncbi:uncharacterized protein EV420DRAFT_1642170 [Desarmillaria tabescens]|uniref:BTB domain-containing protein n=1 Tax=Armillaria tabescens TaxID=1929756 RepID=A0AA39N5T5_ARMTA|nr:uncharacterized protein EV420DRAFT_1642170 [Desarmillaria tabescens]KAK0459181.1 hypothetical protein EV420DRAFT_1642170 [Desarmillaria tabescens]